MSFMRTPAPPVQRRIGASPASTKLFAWRRATRLALLTASICLSMTSSAAQLEYDEYLQRANAARQRGDWQSVASQLAQAINHPDLPASGPRRSAVHLEYGRAVGVFCHYDEAEKFLLMARDIAQAAGSATFDAQFELGVMVAKRGEFARAVRYLEPLAHIALPPGAPAPPQQRMALLHEQLAKALAAVGRSQDAANHSRQALTLRQGGAAGTPPGIDMATPYGTQCRTS